MFIYFYCLFYVITLIYYFLSFYFPVKTIFIFYVITAFYYLYVLSFYFMLLLCFITLFKKIISVLFQKNMLHFRYYFILLLHMFFCCEPAMRRMRADGGEDERAGSRPGDGSEANGRVRKQVVSVRCFASAGVAARLHTTLSKIYGWATNCVPSLRTGSNVRSELGFVGGGVNSREYSWRTS